MASFLMESVVLSFTLGGIIGAIAALHLAQSPERARVRAQHEVDER